MFARARTPLALLTIACSMGFAQQAGAQSPGPGVAAPAGSMGTPLRRVSAPGSMQLVYEYDAPGGKERLVVDPGSLVGDIDRIRNRAEPRRPVAKIVSIAPVETPVTEPAPAPAPAQAHAALSETPSPTPAAATVESAPRKVRVIPLFNVPKENYR